MVKALIILNICHWLADYTWLSTPWMLSAKRYGKPLFPIFCHALVHAVLMGIVLRILFHGTDWLLFWVQLGSHFGIDTLKGKINVWFPKVSIPSNTIHWVIFGGDQLLHQIVIIIMAYYATK